MYNVKNFTTIARCATNTSVATKFPRYIPYSQLGPEFLIFEIKLFSEETQSDDKLVLFDSC